LNLIYEYLYLKNYLYAKDLEGDKCKDLMLNMSVLEDMDILVTRNNERDNVDVDDLDSKGQNLVTFDYFVT